METLTEAKKIPKKRHMVFFIDEASDLTLELDVSSGFMRSSYDAEADSQAVLVRDEDGERTSRYINSASLFTIAEVTALVFYNLDLFECGPNLEAILNSQDTRAELGLILGGQLLCRYAEMECKNAAS